MPAYVPILLVGRYLHFVHISDILSKFGVIYKKVSSVSIVCRTLYTTADTTSQVKWQRVVRPLTQRDESSAGVHRRGGGQWEAQRSVPASILSCFPRTSHRTVRPRLFYSVTDSNLTVPYLHYLFYHKLNLNFHKAVNPPSDSPASARQEVGTARNERRIL